MQNLRNVHVVYFIVHINYLTGVREVDGVYFRGTSRKKYRLYTRGPYLTGVREVDVVYFRGTSRKKYRLYTRGRGTTYGYNI